MNKKELFWISVTVFLTVIAWMILDIYKIKDEIKVDPEVLSGTIIKYTINPKILEILKSKIP